ncbi:MAG TPA: hypothetical protein VJR94_11460 [Candidatus Nitrosocosmicus sp.]|nr:hypothetical protein [Candidatus Nitrosocosmicus sp.]
MHKKSAEKIPMVQISGSCLDFEKERETILELVGELEWGCHYETKFECSSEGKTMGWDFFNMYFEIKFITTLAEVHPKILKEEGNILEQQFMLWLEKQFKKIKKDYHLKLVETPFELSKGFRIDPESYRTEERLWDLR